MALCMCFTGSKAPSIQNLTSIILDMTGKGSEWTQWNLILLNYEYL